MVLIFHKNNIIFSGGILKPGRSDFGRIFDVERLPGSFERANEQ